MADHDEAKRLIAEIKEIPEMEVDAVLSDFDIILKSPPPGAGDPVVVASMYDEDEEGDPIPRELAKKIAGMWCRLPAIADALQSALAEIEGLRVERGKWNAAFPGGLGEAQQARHMANAAVESLGLQYQTTAPAEIRNAIAALSEIEVLRAERDALAERVRTLTAQWREMARICGCLEPGENGKPSCDPSCIACAAMEEQPSGAKP